MAQIILSSDVYERSIIKESDNGRFNVVPQGKNIGSLPTLFSDQGIFISIVNSYFYDLKVVKKLKNLSSNSRALLKYWTFLENSKLEWNHFPSIKRLKPTYLFRSYLLTQIQENNLSQSTASIYINHIKNFYIWAIHEGYLRLDNEKEAPFKIEFIKVKNTGLTAHLRPNFVVNSSDIKIRVAKNSQSKNVRPLLPLTEDSLLFCIQHFQYVSQEFRLQSLLSLLSGLRANEICSFTINSLNTATPAFESNNYYHVTIGPSTGVKTKFGKDRNIEVSAELLCALNNYSISVRRLNRLQKLQKKISLINENKMILSNEKKLEFSLCEEFEPLFISEQGNPINRQTLGARWIDFRKIIQKKVPSFTHKYHDLRSTYATYRLNELLIANLKPTEALGLLMNWMGHNDEKTTWKYLEYLKRKEIFKEKFALLDSIMHEMLDHEDK